VDVDLAPWFGTTSTELVGDLVVRPIQPAEQMGWRLHMERYHYLGCGQLVGESLRYAALVGGELVALLGWAAAALHNTPRDRYIGWDSTTRARQLPLVVNNVRFLILPWIRVRHLASRVLAANLRRLGRDWQAVFGHAVLLAETFVDVARFRGTCYRASNWIKEAIAGASEAKRCVGGVAVQSSLLRSTRWTSPRAPSAVRATGAGSLAESGGDGYGTASANGDLGTGRGAQ
jgi:hypothetical protein